MSGMTITLRVYGLSDKRLDKQLDAFAHDIASRQKYARRIAGWVKAKAKANIRSQRTVDGTPFAPRKDKRKKTAMLKKLGQHLAVISKAREGGGAVVTWKNGMEAGIAGRHQWGVGEAWTPQRAREQYGKPNYKAPCTLLQARALKKEGYRRPRKGKSPKIVSTKALQETFTIGQAGIILRYLRTKKLIGSQFWLDTVPERPFLGISPKLAHEYNARLAKAILKHSFNR